MDEFIEVTKDVNKFAALSKEKQVKYIFDFYYDWSAYYDYIFGNKELMASVAAKALDSNLDFSHLEEKLQDKIIYDNLETIKSFSESKQRAFIADVKSIETYRYLFRYLNIRENMEVLSPNSILAIMGTIKDEGLFMEVYNTPEIFAKLMQKTKLDPQIEVYWYTNFGRMPARYQEIVLKDIKARGNFEEQYTAMYKKASEEAKVAMLGEMPKDFVGQIDYYRLTHKPEAKEAFMAGLKHNTISDEIFSSLLSLYPDNLTLDDMEIVIGATKLDHIVNNKVAIDTLLQDANLFLLINQKIKSSPQIPYYCLDNVFMFCSDADKYEVMDKIAKGNLLTKSKIPGVLEYITSKINEDENYLKDAIDMNQPTYARPSIPSETVEVVYPYLSDEACVYYLGTNKLDLVMQMVDRNPALMQYVNNSIAIGWIRKLENDSPVFHQLPSSGLVNSMFFYKNDPKKKRAILEEIYERSRAGSLELSRTSEIDKVYKDLDENERREFITNISPCYLLFCYAKEEKEELKDLMAKIIVENYDKAFDLVNHVGLFEFTNLPDKDILKIINNVPPYIAIGLYDYSASKLLESVILKNFAKDPYSITKTSDVDEIVYSLSASARKVVHYKLQELLMEIEEQNPKLYELLSKNDSYSRFKFLEKYNNGFFNDELIFNTFMALLEKHPFITTTINYDVLTPELINLNEHFLSKIVKYPDIQTRVINIKNKQKTSYPVFLDLLNSISNDEDRIFDRKMLILLDYFEANEVVYDHKLSSDELENLLRYILLNSKVFKFSKDSLSVAGVDPLKYADEISDLCDEDIKKANSEFDLKNAIFKKYFDITYEDAKVFLYTYNNDLASLDLDPHVIDFVNNIKMIAELRNLRALNKIYKTYSPRYSINDMFIIENELQKAFARKMSDSLSKETTPNMQITIGGEVVDVIDAGLVFSVLTHSTNAYSSMPMIDDDYYKSWNTGKNLSNHGICTALVTDTCLGFPPLKDEKYGVIFGFNHFSEKSISNMGPYDLFSVNNGYRLDTNRISKFMTPGDVEAFTRHTHNEVVLERANLLDNTSVNIQPDYVIITNEMSENQKQNSLAAAKQMNNGKGIPILYVDIARIVAHKKEIVENLLSEFTSTKEINTFSKALSIYESVKCTLFSIKNYDFIDPEYIDDYIRKYIEYISLLEPSEKIGKLQELEKALNAEKAKFDLVVDSGNRHKVFDINYAAHIENIYNNMAMVNLENDMERLTSYMEVANLTGNGLKSHDETHMVRVTMLAHKISEIMGLDEKSIMMVIEAAKNHDKGRTDDGKNAGHGKKSAELYKQNSSLDEYTTNMICAMIEYHEPVDDDLTKEAIFDKYNIPMEDREWLELLCSIIKDADALDRVRFTNPKATLDPKKLRLAEGKLLIKYANDLLAKTSELALEEDQSVTHKA